MPLAKSLMSRKTNKFSKVSQLYFGAEWRELTEAMNWWSSSLLDEVAPTQSSVKCLLRSGFGPLQLEKNSFEQPQKQRKTDVKCGFFCSRRDRKIYRFIVLTICRTRFPISRGGVNKSWGGACAKSFVSP